MRRPMVWLATLSSVCALLLPASVRGQGLPTFSVPARVLVSNGAENDENAPPTTTPRLPPQYQTARRHGLMNDTSQNGEAVRFLVILADRPLLVEARIRVNGQPFRKLRVQRVEELLDQLSQDASGTDAAAESRDPDAATTDESKQALSASSAVDETLLGRLRRYVSATRRTPSPEEVHWLLTHWAEGPPLLFLDPNFQRVRADASPLFAALDLDDDGVLSAEEIGGADRSLMKLDSNQDDVLSLAEIAKAAATSTSPARVTSSIPPVIPIEHLSSARYLQMLSEHFGENTSHLDGDGDGRLSEAELADVRGRHPDLLVTVLFDTEDTSRSQIAVTWDDAAQAETKPILRDASLTLQVGSTWLELSAVQSRSRATSDQISLAAVRDGYPLLPTVDLDEDGRLSVRERRQLPSRLAAFDRDGDGHVSASEVFPTLRLSVGHGPVAHVPLVAVRSIHPPAPAQVGSPPAWFVRMDRNRDEDLTPREFLGGKDQFRELDKDGDGLISMAEANAATASEMSGEE